MKRNLNPDKFTNAQMIACEGIKAGKVLFSGASDQSRGLAQNEVNSHKFGEESPNDVARLIQRRLFAQTADGCHSSRLLHDFREM